MHFSKIENFPYGKINERGFSNPHPSTVDSAHILAIRMKGWDIGQMKNSPQYTFRSPSQVGYEVFLSRPLLKCARINTDWRIYASVI